MGQRVLCVGDVHGCYEELKDLLRLVGYTPADRVVLLGDLVDRGPDPVGVVRYAQEMGFESVKGNHDEKAIRWRKRASEEQLTGRPNKMVRPKPERLAQWEGLSDADLRWMDGLPWIVDLGDDWVGVHAGFEPAYTPRDLVTMKKEDSVCRVRYVDVYGKTVSPKQVGGEVPGAFYWTEWKSGYWRAPKKVVYGHAVHDLETPRRDLRDDIGGDFWGVDTGGCFGGRLTAWVKTDGKVETASVPAKAKYATLTTPPSE